MRVSHYATIACEGITGRHCELVMGKIAWHAHDVPYCNDPIHLKVLNEAPLLAMEPFVCLRLLVAIFHHI